MHTTIVRTRRGKPKSKAAGSDFFVRSQEQARRAPGIAAGRMDRALEIRARIEKLEEELKALKIAEAPKVILPELHDGKTGRIDARKVADFMGVALKPMAEGLGLNYKGVHRNPSAGAFQQALRPVKRSLEILHEFFGPAEAIRAWLNTPHPDLMVRRTFAPGANLFASFEVYGATKEKPTGMPKVSAGYLVRKPDGTTVVQVAPSLINPTSLGKLSRIVGTRLPVDASGDMEFVLSVKDEISGKTLEVKEPFTVAGDPVPAAAPSTGR